MSADAAGPATVPPRVSVIVVSYEVRDLLRRCLQDVFGQRGVRCEVLVIDNASRDRSADMVAAEFPGAQLERNDTNSGFARANNRLLARASGDYLALVNPDTELPPDALRAAVDVLARHPRAGAAGIALLNPDGSAQPSCFAFPGLLNQVVESLGLHRLLLPLGFGVPSLAPAPRGEGRVAWVSGAFLVMTREAFARVGGLDENLFMYGEEMEWCWRATQAGFEIWWTDRAKVVHHGGASGADVRGEMFVRSLQGRLYFLRRHGGRAVAAIAREAMALGCALRWLYWRLRTLAGGAAPGSHARAQLERFGAALRWRWSGGR